MYLALDLETTGTNPSTDRIIEFAAQVFTEDGQIVEEWTTLINPEQTITDFISHLTGITQGELDAAPLLPAVLPKIKELLQNHILVGHNVYFDVAFLQTLLPEYQPTVIYDTFELAGIVLPQADSLALEVLSVKLNLPDKGTHRALDDVRAAKALFFWIKQELAQFPPQLRQRLHNLAAASHWPARQLFAQLAPASPTLFTEEPASPPPAPATVTVSRTEFDTQWRQAFPDVEPPEDTTDDDFAVSHRWIQADQINPWALIGRAWRQALTTGQHILLVFPWLKLQHLSANWSDYLTRWPTAWHHTIQIWGDMPPLAHTKLTQLWQSSFLENSDIVCAIKSVVWNWHCQSGHPETLHFHHQEKRMYPALTTTWTDPDAQHPQLPLSPTALVTLCTHSQLTTDFPPLTHCAHLVIVNLEQLEHGLDRQFNQRSYYSAIGDALNKCRPQWPTDPALSALDNQYSLTWGLLGLVLNKDSETAVEIQLLPLPPHNQRSQNWLLAFGNFITAAEQWLADKNQLLAPVRDFYQAIRPWKEAFLAPRPNFTYGLKTESESEYTLYVSYPATPTLWQDLIRDRAVTLFSEGVRPNAPESAYLQKLWHLDNFTIHHQSPMSRPRTLLVPTDNFNETTRTEWLRDLLLRLGGRTYVSFDSVFTLEKFFLNYLDTFAAAGIKLLAQGFGGQAKNLFKYHQDPDRTILLGNNAYLESIEPATTTFQHLIIGRLPFDYTAVPPLSIRKSWFSEGFGGYDLPRALLRWQRLLNLVPATGQVWLLDRRVLEKKYGADFLAPRPDFTIRQDSADQLL